MGSQSAGSNSWRLVQERVQLAMASTEAYRFCRNAHNLAIFLSLVQRVDETGTKSALWSLSEDAGSEQLEMRLTEDLPSRGLQWR